MEPQIPAQPAELGKNRPTEKLLLVLDRFRGIHDMEAVLRSQLFVFLENAGLEQTIGLRSFLMQSQILPGLIPLELGAAGEDALERGLERHAEVESDSRHGSETIERTDPLRVYAAGHVARKRGVHV